MVSLFLKIILTIKTNKKKKKFFLQRQNAANKTLTEFELSVNEDLVMNLSQAFLSQASHCELQLYF